MKVGLLGEAPHDTTAIAALLNQRFRGEVQFFALVDDVRGSQIEEQRIKRILRREYEFEKPALVIFIRDLDGLESDEAQLRLRKGYFSEWKSVVDGNALFLLNIYAIEALILADIEAYNKFYACEVEVADDPMLIPKPEIYLKTRSPYLEGQLSAILSSLRIEIVVKNCRYFKTFLNEFDRIVSAYHQ
jgi:hypothetical protein